MTGEQLNQYIERISTSIDLMEKSHPEIMGRLKSMRAQISAIEYLTKDARENNPSKELSNEMESYVTIAVESLLMDSDGKPKKHISYAPMHMEIAKYNLNISRVCDILGISANIRSLLNKNKHVNISILKKIADFLECGVDDLIETIDHTEYIRRLKKYVVFKTPAKEEKNTDLVKILHEITGKQLDNKDDKSRMARRDLDYRPGTGKAVKKIFDEMIENMDERHRKVLRNNVAHNTEKASFEFIASILDYKDEKQLMLEDYEDFND